jgi:hypothetical protein
MKNEPKSLGALRFELPAALSDKLLMGSIRDGGRWARLMRYQTCF